GGPVGPGLALELKEPLGRDSDPGPALQLVMSADDLGGREFRVYSSAAAGEWTLHATGRIGEPPEAAAESAHVDLDELRRAASEEVDGADLYRALRDAGLEYGPAFQSVTRVWRRDGEALGRLAVPPEL